MSLKTSLKMNVRIILFCILTCSAYFALLIRLLTASILQMIMPSFSLLWLHKYFKILRISAKILLGLLQKKTASHFSLPIHLKMLTGMFLFLLTVCYRTLRFMELYSKCSIFLKIIQKVHWDQITLISLIVFLWSLPWEIAKLLFNTFKEIICSICDLRGYTNPSAILGSILLGKLGVYENLKPYDGSSQNRIAIKCMTNHKISV